MSLLDVDCRYAPIKSKAYKLPDTNRLYLLISPKGAKYWRYDYTFFDKSKTYAIGVYPKITLAEARRLRDEAAKKIDKGIDPILARNEEKLLAQYKNAQTVELVFRQWHEQFYDTWKPKTAHVILRRLELYIFPHLGNVPVDKVTPEMLLTCLRRAEKSSRDVAERLLKYCYKAFVFAKNTGRPHQNPTEGLIYSLKRYKRGHYAAIDINELPELLKVIHSEENRIHHLTFLGLRLLMLTAVRTNELIKMQWSEIHFDLAQWIIPGERMKMEQDHIVPLSKQATQILLELKEMNGHREWVFASKQHYKKHISEGTFIKALERMGYKGKMTGHGFRTIFMGVSKEKLKVSHDIPDRQLAHVPKGTNGKAYDRAKYIDERTALMQRYADYLDELLYNQPKQRTMNERQNRIYDQPTNYYAINFGATNFGGSNGAYQVQLRNTLPPHENRRLSQTSQGHGQPDQLLDGGRYSELH